jgi:hypothetical protein
LDGNEIGLAHKLVTCADDVNILRDNTNTIKKNTESVIDASK